MQLNTLKKYKFSELSSHLITEKAAKTGRSASRSSKNRQS